MNSSPDKQSQNRPPPNRHIDATFRLNKLITEYGLCSRRRADEWIFEGKVAVDGVVCREPWHPVNPARQRVMIHGKPLRHPPPKLYVALYKPAGTLSTRTDPYKREKVVDLLPKKFKKAGVYPVGRLDGDSEGLILLSNDGEWTHHVIHPRHVVWKEYQVEVQRSLQNTELRQLASGIELDGQKTLPANVWPTTEDPKVFHIEIREGRNRQIRRMCSALGLKVKRLVRLRIGDIHLGGLEAGQWRYLEDWEASSILAGCKNPPPKPSHQDPKAAS